MEVTCSRCHQTIPVGSCFCPTCGLPQLVYTTDQEAVAAHPERWTEPVRDASVVEWKPALRTAMLVAIPAGLLSCGFSPVGLLGLFWVAAAAAWAVSLYVRRQRTVWITMGAGARIGLVTGLMSGWLAFVATGAALFAMRYFLHQGQEFDQIWQQMVNQSVSQQAQAADAQALAAIKALALSPEGRAGILLCGLTLLEIALLIFAAAGGALGARMMARSRRTEL
jgi:hypothetical protein